MPLVPTHIAVCIPSLASCPDAAEKIRALRKRNASARHEQNISAIMAMYAPEPKTVLLGTGHLTVQNGKGIKLILSAFGVVRYRRTSGCIWTHKT